MEEYRFMYTADDARKMTEQALTPTIKWDEVALLILKSTEAGKYYTDFNLMTFPSHQRFSIEKAFISILGREGYKISRSKNSDSRDPYDYLKISWEPKLGPYDER